MEDVSKSRREFVRNLSCWAASLLFLGSCADEDDQTSPVVPDEDPPITYLPRPARENPYVSDTGRPRLVCVEGQDIDTMLQVGLEALGGLTPLVNGQPRVLIKPNCNYVDAYPGISSTACVLGLIREVREVFAGTIQVGDQGYHEPSMVYPHMDLNTLVPEAGAELVTFSGTQNYRVRQEAWADGLPDYLVYSEVYEAPVIISTSTLKRHRYATMTCALKNNVGTIVGSRMCCSRANLHARQGTDFQWWVAEIAALIRPELTIIDARTILTRDGPLTEWGDPVRADKLVISGDMVAADAYCAQLLASHDATFSVPMIEPTLTRAAELGLGTRDLNQVEIVETTA